MSNCLSNATGSTCADEEITRRSLVKPFIRLLLSVTGATALHTVIFLENTTGGSARHHEQQQDNEDLVYFQFHNLCSKITVLGPITIKPIYLAGNFNIQRVLVAPLDWGLGHATRCIPLIRALLLNGYEVVLAAEKAQAALLQQEFPQLQCLHLEGYRVRYSRSRWLLPLRIIMQVPRLLRIIKKEHAWLQGVLRSHRINLVISDNRFGLYTDAVPCIFITHQLTIKAPFRWLEKKMQQVNYRYINHFTACWVPDAAGEPNLAGVLSHPRLIPSIKPVYIGLLSRMQYEVTPKQYDYCILLSGPEPQRSILEEKIYRGIASIPGNILLVRGLPGQEAELSLPSHVTVRNHLGTEAIQQAILQSEYIICRSGYTTLMELVSLRKKAILIPTPGQTEQEYLAERLFRSGTFYMVPQEMFSVEKDLTEASTFPYKHLDIPLFEADEAGRLLSETMATFVDQ